jgi:AcrR family transcriptional regulator
MVSEPAVANTPPVIAKGRVDKRRAIVDAALEVFARVGFANANLDVIAASAGVAKPTIYNHFGDKEKLFRAVIFETSAEISEKNLRAVESLPIRPDNLGHELEVLGSRLNSCLEDDRSRALQRLMIAEIGHFPDLMDEWRRSGPNRLAEALAGRFAMLAGGGYLRQDDAVCTATQFIALISSELPQLSAWGTRNVSHEDVERVVRSGVDTFIRAYGMDR